MMIIVSRLKTNKQTNKHPRTKTAHEHKNTSQRYFLSFSLVLLQLFVLLLLFIYLLSWSFFLSYSIFHVFILLYYLLYLFIYFHNYKKEIFSWISITRNSYGVRRTSMLQQQLHLHANRSKKLQHFVSGLLNQNLTLKMYQDVHVELLRHHVKFHAGQFRTERENNTTNNNNTNNNRLCFQLTVWAVAKATEGWKIKEKRKACWSQLNADMHGRRVII